MTILSERVKRILPWKKIWRMCYISGKHVKHIFKKLKTKRMCWEFFLSCCAVPNSPSKKAASASASGRGHRHDLRHTTPFLEPCSSREARPKDVNTPPNRGGGDYLSPFSFKIMNWKWEEKINHVVGAEARCRKASQGVERSPEGPWEGQVLSKLKPSGREETYKVGDEVIGNKEVKPR